MKEYRVITKQYVYQYATVKANSHEEAEDIALASDALDWNWCDYGNTEIEFSEEIGQ